ncbi:Methyltransferase domain-containing protein [Jiangella alba]|uniref:Methyltransferase domain-containing protein n=2 Tax=Jiangella alba TaxID=561176 RepID=A0A1H5PY21_9ACTN|nr:Methyltransferase domain-containing protein [Jiangella alba]
MGHATDNVAEERHTFAMTSDVWDEESARRYDETSAEMFTPGRIDPAVDLLAGLAADTAALEFAIGTGRVAVPLHARGVPVTGIDLSGPMLDQLRRKPGAAGIPVVAGDMATTRVDGEFGLVYLVFNTIANLRTQAEQVACFRNAARHLTAGGRFVVELWVPPLRRFPPGQTAVPFDVGPDHLGFDTMDLVTQQGTSHHFWREADGSYRRGESNFRYVWPSECDLMAQLAGLELEDRWADWDRSPFTSGSESHVSVWRKP